MANGKSPVDMLLKIKKFIDALVKERTKYGKKENIDVLTLLDQIKKRSEKYVDDNKKLLPLGVNNTEISGSVSRAEWSERPYTTVNPQDVMKEVSSKAEFFQCVKVINGELEKIIPKERIAKIGTSKKRSVISLKFVEQK